MIYDKQNLFLDHTAIPAAGGPTVVGDVIDLWAGNTTQPNAAAPAGVNGAIGGPLAALLGRMDEVEFDVQISDGDAAGGTSVLLQLVCDDLATLASAPTVLKETAVVPLATLKAGYKFRFSGDVGVGVFVGGVVGEARGDAGGPGRQLSGSARFVSRSRRRRHRRFGRGGRGHRAGAARGSPSPPNRRPPGRRPPGRAAAAWG